MNKLLKSTGFRLPFLYALFFIASSSCVFLLIYLTTTNVLESKVKLSLTQEMEELEKAYRAKTDPNLIGIPFLINQPGNQKRTGNLNIKTLSAGWHTLLHLRHHSALLLVFKTGGQQRKATSTKSGCVVCRLRHADRIGH